MHRRLIPLVVLSSILFWICVAVKARSAPASLYDVVDLGRGTVGALDAAGNAYGSTIGSTQQAAQYTPALVTLGFLPQGTFSLANGHQNGRTVGYSGTGTHSLQTHAFLHENGVTTDLGTAGLPEWFSAAVAINGQRIVGYCDNGQPGHPALCLGE